MSRITRLAGLAALTANLALPPPAAGDITVPCPGVMIDSSAAIIAALQSVGPGGTVRLEPCTYYLSAPIVITGTFDGALVGAGMGRTILTTLPDADGIEDVLMINWISDLEHPGVRGPTLGPTLFHFSLFGETPSRVAMSNMTITVTDPRPAFASARAAGFGDALLAIVTVEGKWVSTDFDEVALKGRHTEWGLGSNAFCGIEMWGELSFWPESGTQRPMVGRHTLTRSLIEGVNTGYNPYEMADSSMMVRHNRFADLAVDAFDGGDMEASVLHVSHNLIELAGAPHGGIWIIDADGALVEQNSIAGEAAVGITLAAGRRYRVLNNDLSSLVVPPAEPAIVLGTDTSDSLVVGTDPAQVLDLGTNNRVLAGKAKR